MLLNCGIGRLLRVPWTARRSNQSILKQISPEYSFEELMLKLKLQYVDHLMYKTDSLEKSVMVGIINVGGEGDNRCWDDWMASLTQWTWVWVNFGSWWWTQKPGLLQSTGLQSIGHDWTTELNCFIKFMIYLANVSMRKIFSYTYGSSPWNISNSLLFGRCIRKIKISRHCNKLLVGSITDFALLNIMLCLLFLVFKKCVE